MLSSSKSITPTGSDLDPLLSSSPRYDTSGYYPNNWNSNSGYPPNYNSYYPATNNNQTQYPGGPTMVLYPQLYSTVNQNQIHLHLHGTDKWDQYLSSHESAAALTISPTSRGAIEIGLIPPNSAVLHETGGESLQEIDQRNQDNSCVTTDPSVWRPY